ncbi:MAG: hypothetical protein M3024_00120 [Candidatus Dormibacteraeota bacterium]|nr:hypothetical protein [Candidatus Dormibacteraeota bacterium]
MGTIDGMEPNVFCGNCGFMLEGRTAVCRRCGAHATGHLYRRHNPFAAAALAIVPGLGHLYLGHYGKGLGILTGFGLLQFLGGDLDLTAIGAAAGVPMELGGLGLWAWSIWDAYQSARRQERYSETRAPEYETT